MTLEKKKERKVGRRPKKTKTKTKTKPHHPLARYKKVFSSLKKFLNVFQHSLDHKACSTTLYSAFFRRPGFDSWVGKIPWRRERLPTPVFWPGEFYGLYSCGVSKIWTRLSNFHFHFQPFTEWGGPSPVSLQHEARGLHFAQSLCLW